MSNNKRPRNVFIQWMDGGRFAVADSRRVSLFGAPISSFGKLRNTLSNQTWYVGHRMFRIRPALYLEVSRSSVLVQTVRVRTAEVYVLMTARHANRAGIISAANVSLFAIEKFAQIADKHKLPSGWQGLQHGTDIDDTVSEPSHRGKLFCVTFCMKAGDANRAIGSRWILSESAIFP
jgi:hypothetical protein